MDRTVITNAWLALPDAELGTHSLLTKTHGPMLEHSGNRKGDDGKLVSGTYGIG